MNCATLKLIFQNLVTHADWLRNTAAALCAGIKVRLEPIMPE